MAPTRNGASKPDGGKFEEGNVVDAMLLEAGSGGMEVLELAEEASTTPLQR